MEILQSIKRAGADLIITYFAKEAARILRETETRNQNKNHRRDAKSAKEKSK